MNLRELATRFPRTGRIEAIVIRPARLVDAIFVDYAQLVQGRGLLGDHRATQLRESEQARRREITLMQHEHLPLIAAWSALPQVDARHLRRNLLVSGVNLAATHSPFPNQHMIWCIGAQVRIEITGPCPPCSRMEGQLGQGGYTAMRGHSGMTARVLSGGVVRVGDSFVFDDVLVSGSDDE